MASVIYPGGSADIVVPAGESIAISCIDDTATVYYSTYPIVRFPETYSLETTVQNTTTVLGSFTNGKHVRVEAGTEKVYYNVGAAPTVVAEELQVTVSTIADTATATAAQHQGLVLYQDASGASVTMTTLTGTQLAAAFQDLAIGESVKQYHASNDATNTSTLSGGADVTLVGSGAVTSQGGQYLLIKTAATTFDLVRIG